MDLDEARAVLGLDSGDDWDEVRASYRRLMLDHHPDRSRATAGHHRAAQINEAYAVLIRAKRAGAARPVPPPPASRSGRSATGSAGSTTGAAAPGGSAPPAAEEPVLLDGAEIVRLALTPDEAFSRLLAAGDEIGEISYVDRSCAIFEVIVRHEEETWSLLVTLRGRPSGGTEVFFALEALERVASPSPAPVVRKLVAALRRIGGRHPAR